MKKENILFSIILGITFIGIVVIMFLIYHEIHHSTPPKQKSHSFQVEFIQQSTTKGVHENFMISPYSVEMALSMLREGSGRDTYQELSNVVPKREIPDLEVKNHIYLANALFVKDSYQPFIQKDFQKKLKSSYQAEVLVDSFTSPKKINSWVNDKTQGMIPSLLENMDPQFVFGIGNATAFIEDWEQPFDCSVTRASTFTLEDGEEMEVSMMSNSFEEGASYYSSEEADVVFLPYQRYQSSSGKEVDKGGSQFEFVGILPKDMDSYLEDFSQKKITTMNQKRILANGDTHLYVELPRFEASYSFDSFADTLREMGITKIFTEEADFSSVISNHPVSISDAIHKTYIQVNENGTKASGTTYFGSYESAAMNYETIFLSFNRPFLYFIQDVDTHEILFFGMVYEPEEWNLENNCENS